MRARIVIAVSCATPLACALVTDLSSLSGDAGDAAAPTCDAATACIAANVPATWRPIAYHEGFVGCPTGFTSEKYVTKPVGACACECNMTTPPRCDVGQLQTYFGSVPGCASTGLSNSFNGNCAQISGPLATYFAAKPLQPSGAACTSTALPDASTVNAEACIPQQCADTICEGVVPPGYKACVISDGDIPCPSGTPFSVRTTVGTSASVVCGTGCLCAVSATCSNPKVEFFTDPACKTSLVTLPADGTCVTSGENGVVVGSAKYTAALDASCSGSGAPDASTSLVAPRTVCCAP